MMVSRGSFAKLACSLVEQSSMKQLFTTALRHPAPPMQRLAFAINIESIPLLETSVETPLENAI